MGFDMAFNSIWFQFKSDQAGFEIGVSWVHLLRASRDHGSSLSCSRSAEATVWALRRSSLILIKTLKPRLHVLAQVASRSGSGAVHLRVCVYMCVYVCICAYLCISVYMYVHMYVYVCIYIYIYIYVHIHN